MEKSIQINVPVGYEIDKEKSTFENIVFKPIETKLPKTWDELGSIEGFYVRNNSEVNFVQLNTENQMNRNIFATREQAEASIALAQLSQLREVYRNGWKPDWSCNDVKHIIRFDHERASSNECDWYRSHFFSFQSREVRDAFLGNFRDLIEKAKPLMS